MTISPRNARYYEPPSPRHLPMPSHAGGALTRPVAIGPPDQSRLTFVPQRSRGPLGPSRFRHSAPALVGADEGTLDPYGAASVEEDYLMLTSKAGRVRKVASFAGIKRERDDTLILASPPSVPRDLGAMGADPTTHVPRSSPSKGAKRAGKGE